MRFARRQRAAPSPTDSSSNLAATQRAYRAVSFFLNEFLRINAVRRMLTIIDVRPPEISMLVLLAVVFAILEGIGLSLLLPILQYAAEGTTAITDSSGIIWRTVAGFMDLLHLPITLPILLLLAFVPILLRQVIFYANSWYSAVVSGRIGMRLREQTLDTIFGADPDFFSRHPLGHVAGVVGNQTDVGAKAIVAVVKQFSIGLLIIVYVAILFVLSVPLTFIILFFAVAVSLAVRATIRRTREYGKATVQVTQQLWQTIVERFGMMRLVKMRNQKESESGRVWNMFDRLRSIEVSQSRLYASMEVTADPLLIFSVFFTLYVGIAVLGMTLPQLGLLLFVVTRLNAKVKEFNSGRQTISRNMAGLLLVRDLTLDAAASNTIHPGPAPFEGLRSELVLSNVSFKYPAEHSPHKTSISEDHLVLKDISATIPAGSFTALVGRSGVGKSTLVELLPRLRDTTAGTITYDGVDIRNFDVGTLRRGIGYLTQTALLFNDTVRQNLTYGLGFEASEDQIREALEHAHAGFVYDFPKGLETVLGDRGVRLSGGEQQRIALARLLLEDTSLLILDEPTSALDSESEAYIQETLADLRGRKTIIVIAHRLATVVQADQLLVIEDGHLVERGTHQELFAASSVYRRLFDSQVIQAPTHDEPGDQPEER